MSDPESLDEARKAKALGELLDAGAKQADDVEVESALRTALSIRGKSGGILGESARARLAAELFPRKRRRGPVATVALVAAAIAATVMVATSVLTMREASVSSTTAVPKQERRLVAQSARDAVATVLHGTESTRAEAALTDALAAYRSELVAKEVGE